MKSKIQNVTFSTYKVGKKFYATIYNSKGLNGQPLKINRNTQETSERPAKKRAEEIISELFGNSAPEKPAGANVNSLDTISDMIDDWHNNIYLEDIKVHSPETQKKMRSDIKSRLNHLKRYLGNESAKNLDMKLINFYIKSRREDVKKNGANYSDGTIQVELNYLKVAVKVLKNGLKFDIKENVKDHIRLKSVERAVTLTDEEYDNMLQKFREYDEEHFHNSNWAFFLEMIMFTGVRWGQMKLLKYEHINWEARRLEFPAETTKHEKVKKHLVYLDSKKLDILEKRFNDRLIDKAECNCTKKKTCKGKVSEEFVFPNKHKRCEPFSKDMFYILWNKFCEELELTKYDKYRKNDIEMTILPHDIRRTAIVKMIGTGIDRKYIMSQTGHKSHKTFDKYNIIQENTMQRLIENQDARILEVKKAREAIRQDGVWES